MFLEFMIIASAGMNISICCFLFYIYFNVKTNIITPIKMNIEELLTRDEPLQICIVRDEPIQIYNLVKRGTSSNLMKIPSLKKREKDYQLLWLVVVVVSI